VNKGLGAVGKDAEDGHEIEMTDDDILTGRPQPLSLVRICYTDNDTTPWGRKPAQFTHLVRRPPKIRHHFVSERLRTTLKGKKVGFSSACTGHRVHVGIGEKKS
jgi:hypothetical protein